MPFPPHYGNCLCCAVLGCCQGPTTPPWPSCQIHSSCLVDKLVCVCVCSGTATCRRSRGWGSRDKLLKGSVSAQHWQAPEPEAWTQGGEQSASLHFCLHQHAHRGGEDGGRRDGGRESGWNGEKDKEMEEAIKSWITQKERDQKK